VLATDDAPAWSGWVHQVSVGNGRYHGGGLTVADHAAINDELLNVHFVLPGTLWQLLASIAHLKFDLTKPKVLRRWSGAAAAKRAGVTGPSSLWQLGDAVNPA
jgi:diacylglycerol kinase (ATP)